MRYIAKGKEPASLLAHRKNKEADYANLPKKAKNDLRKALLKEQGYVCCYCMQRIREDNSKIEHWKPQKHTRFQLNYQNLLAACQGNEGEKKDRQHCDTHKGEQEITINPTDKTRNCELFIKYRKNGLICSDDPVINEELNTVLNLNTQTLAENRAVIMDYVKNEITRVKGKNSAWPIPYVRKIIQKYGSRHNEKFIPYCQVVIYFLKKRFKNEL
ncbi:retron system putative HNH endonuclease [Desulfobacterales bacterium HSG2]|nr:retron system putative HNH endonuclease [Desulfobacterales bacterium HSG2]